MATRPEGPGVYGADPLPHEQRREVEGEVEDLLADRQSRPADTFNESDDAAIWHLLRLTKDSGERAAKIEQELVGLRSQVSEIHDLRRTAAEIESLRPLAAEVAELKTQARMRRVVDFDDLLKLGGVLSAVVALAATVVGFYVDSKFTGHREAALQLASEKALLETQHEATQDADIGFALRAATELTEIRRNLAELEGAVEEGARRKAQGRIRPP